MIDKDEFDGFDEICYALSVFDLSQLKLKSAAAYARAVAKLVPHIATPTDDDVIEALMVAYEDVATGKIYRKFDRLGREGIIKVPE